MLYDDHYIHVMAIVNDNDGYENEPYAHMFLQQKNFNKNDHFDCDQFVLILIILDFVTRYAFAEKQSHPYITKHSSRHT